jgi:hypothetical protein
MDELAMIDHFIAVGREILRDPGRQPCLLEFTTSALCSSMELGYRESHRDSLLSP